MCLTYPGLVLSVGDGEAVVRTEGRQRRATTLVVPDVAVGDWVIVAAGSIVTRLDPAEAAEIRGLIEIADGHGGSPDVHAP
ncbi:MAG TPA: HypC/HybG/HupF family hydrogenase formation chaperone [Candidatus Limnocylindrales bacterium]|jgi:hydrogenase assembly chaperone HypC/HupF|nr:HypC/HybG/HupF family hydrogenase formation chaperone [Candidatus Limnocylindrales bacterium]